MSKELPELYLENQLCFPLYAASRLTTKMYAPLLRELDLTYPQYLVLLALWQNDSQSVSQIGERLFLESNTLTPLLKRLEAKNLITRIRSPRDERSVTIHLTPQGQELKQKAQAVPGKILECFSDTTIQSEEVVQFQQTLFKLLNVLGEK